MSYTRLLYHIIFRTKYGVPAITEKHEEILYRYIWKFTTEQKSVLYRVNGMPDHVHLFVDLHPSLSVAEYVQKLKNGSHLVLDEHKAEFPDFYAWSVGYCALSYGEREKAKIINYIKNQKTHHKTHSFADEIQLLAIENGIEINQDYFDKHI